MKAEELKRHPKCHCSDGKPKLLQVKIINKCTGDCSFCIDKGNFAPKEVNADAMIEAILAETDYPTVDITGGEPFLDFDVLLKVLKAIRPHKEYIVLNTNGSLLSEEKVEQLNGLIDFLKIGLQHYDESKNAEIIKTKISFDNIKKSLKNKQFKVWFNMVVNKSWENEKESFVDKIVELCKELNVDGVSMNELRYTGINNGYEQYAEDHIKGYEFFQHLDVIKPKTSEQLITEGCVDDFEYKGIEFRLKRLCGYKFKSKEQTFKVIYSTGLKVDDWILDI
ncbi:MAG TPA: radical SAM protein [Gallicola sp.]|nr:radical SAM protein [Gallicola sp.]